MCGHVEWAAPGDSLPQDYVCPLCGAGRSALLALDDPRLARHGVVLEEVASKVWRARKSPPFHRDYEHFAYVLQHPDGVVLFDAPPLARGATVAAVTQLGEPRVLVVSHSDFVGVARDWADALEIEAWMGEGDQPLAGNRFAPDVRVAGPQRLADDLELVPVPGHTPGSLAVYWAGAPDGPVLCCGDAVCVVEDGGEAIVAFAQEGPAGEAIQVLLRRPIALLAACTGLLPKPARTLERLLATASPCARPWRAEVGGVRVTVQPEITWAREARA